MSKIRAFNAVVYVLVVVPFAILFMYMFGRYNRVIRRFVAKIFLKIFCVKYEEIGSIDKEAQILVMNHQSFMDVIVLEAICPLNLCWIAKKELGEAFLYGHALKAPKMILINRESKREIIRLLKEAEDRLHNNRVLCIFPEGTRSKGGEKLLPFKQGAKVLIDNFKLKVQPIVFCGTRANLDVGAFKFDNSNFTIKYLESFIPSGDDWYNELKELMQDEYTKIYTKSDICMGE
ncbi:lysophospholipid acyltransferase family protein [Helicobacter sp. WB40]|uniref:lysophospholipid acyltransferase family protein n=1 Tax=Helicobacter sp. WB40 TaxID=3004130 RepID=UPI0022EBF99B|nr:lysophospholipid acyltransferase family protein [Helicobacter sp. WB40]MDA3966398.1 lysophospholipid acyltransferase family protein [Helicobacter sp. WB40]